MAVEIEAKFHVQNNETAAEDMLVALMPDSTDLADIERQDLHDLYLETPDRSILRSGYTLRVRTRRDRSDLRRKATIKSLGRDAGKGDGAVHARSEVEAELSPKASALNVSDYPKDLRRTLAKIAGKSKRLEPILAIEQVRSIGSVLFSGPQNGDPGSDPGSEHAGIVGELSVDDVAVLNADGDPIDSFREVEFERAAECPASRFNDFVAELARKPDLQPANEGKLVRGLELAARHVPGRPAGEFDIRADMTVAEAGRMVWRKQLTAVLLTEAGARRGEDIEFVHDMRVATRRARAAWMHYGSAYDEGAMRSLTKGLKRTAAALGEVRDHDVALDALASYTREAPATDGEVLEAVAEQWRNQRAESYVRLLAWLDSKPYSKFIKHMVRHCSTPGANSSPDRPAELVRHVLPNAVIESFGAVRDYAPHFDADEPVEEEMLHAMRIDCKRLRYAIEPLSHLMGSDGKEFVKTLKRMQDVLGDLNDASVAQARISELGDSAKGNPAIDRYLEKQSEVIERCRTTAESVWRPLTSEESLGRLVRSLSNW